MRLAAAVVILAASAAASEAQPSPDTPGGLPKTSWSTNVLGVLQFGPNVEFERALTPSQSLGGGIRLPMLGVMSHVINDGIQSGWTGYGIWHWYPQGAALRRWYLGPHLELGATRNETFTSRIFGWGLEFGHRWIKPNGFSVVVGGLLGTFKSDDTWTDGTGSAGNETYYVWMLNVSLGRTR